MAAAAAPPVPSHTLPHPPTPLAAPSCALPRHPAPSHTLPYPPTPIPRPHAPSRALARRSLRHGLVLLLLLPLRLSRSLVPSLAPSLAPLFRWRRRSAQQQPQRAAGARTALAQEAGALREHYRRRRH
eukprot:352458-Prymnesium_polylepis.1